MFAVAFSKRLNVAPGAFAAAFVGTLAAATTLFVPTRELETVVMGSGIPALFAAADPPLVATARVLVALVVGIGAGGLTWLMALLLSAAPGEARHGLIATVAKRVRFVGKGDVHPDAPARRPVFAARDLGTPFLEVRARKPKRESEPVLPAAAEPMGPPVVQKLPANLDVPLSAFDPAAIPTLAAEPVRPVAALARAPSASAPDLLKRIESLAPAPPAHPVPRAVVLEQEPLPIATPRTDATVHALLDRLERGIARREAPAPPPPPPAPPSRPSLEEALAELRQLAMRA